MTEVTEVIERRFRTAGRPRLSAVNVAGGTRIQRGAGNEVVVRATKRAPAGVAGDARRLLDNIVVTIEQRGDEITVSQRAFLVEHGWLSLFRERRAVVDYEVELPAEAEVFARSVSGDVVVSGGAGPVEVEAVSAEIRLQDLRGPLRARTVSGECRVERCAGALEARSVSGDVRVVASTLPSLEARTVSGETDLEAALIGGGSFGVRTVSGDVTLATPSPFVLEFRTMSGGVSAPDAVEVERHSRREYVVRHGTGGPRIRVRTMSGGLSVARKDVQAPGAQPEEMSFGISDDRSEEALGILQRLERGEIDVGEAARLLDAAR